MFILRTVQAASTTSMLEISAVDIAILMEDSTLVEDIIGVVEGILIAVEEDATPAGVAAAEEIVVVVVVNSEFTSFHLLSARSKLFDLVITS